MPRRTHALASAVVGVVWLGACQSASNDDAGAGAGTQAGGATAAGSGGQGGSSGAGALTNGGSTMAGRGGTEGAQAGRSSSGASGKGGGMAALAGGASGTGNGGARNGGGGGGGASAGGGAGGSGVPGGAGQAPNDDPCEDPGLVWRSANKTNYTSYPDPGSEECVKYNGCMWAGQFAACNAKKPEDWVASHNIVAAFPDFGALELHDLCLRKGDKTIVVTVLDTCGDSDCDGCCTENRGSADELIDIESYTNDRFGVADGAIEWADLGVTTGDGCGG